MTIDSRSVVKTLIEQNGHYYEDPQLYSIWEYTNDWGGTSFAIFYDYRYEDIAASPHVHHAKLLWERRHGKTLYGEIWMEENI